MDTDWPSQVRREYRGSDASFDFPIRQLGWANLLGLFFVGFSLLFIWDPAKTAWEFGQKWLHGDSHFGNVVFTLFPAFFVLAGLLPMGAGVLILFGRCRVQWSEGKLWTTEIAGPFSWRRQLPQKPVSKLDVIVSTSCIGNRPPHVHESLSGLVAEFADDSKALIVFGYPRAWMWALAAELKRCLESVPGATDVAVVEVVGSSPWEKLPGDVDVFEKPTGSRVEMEENRAGMRIIVPPIGVWRGSKALLFFALFWCGFMAVFTALISRADFSSQPGSAIPELLFLGLFWTVGLGLLVASIELGKRSALLVVDGTRLQVKTSSLLSAKHWEWDRTEINAIRADTGSVEINDQPVLELQIHPRTGKKISVLAGRDEADLRWIATRLRRALNLPARSKEEPITSPRQDK